MRRRGETKDMFAISIIEHVRIRLDDPKLVMNTLHLMNLEDLKNLELALRPQQSAEDLDYRYG